MQIAEQQNHPNPAAAFVADFVQCWNQLPNKAFFLSLFAAWILLFHFLGNATFGYIDTRSLFGWMVGAYTGNDWEEGHGLLIPVVILALFWWKRNQLVSLKLDVWWPAILLLAFSLGLHVLGYVVQQPRLSIVGLYLGIYALMGLAWGPAWLRASFFPMFLFAYCIPFASLGAPVTTVTFYLRLFVAKIAASLGGNILGMDIVREGTNLFNSTHTYGYDVAAACSGMRSLVAIFTLATVYGFVTFNSNWKRLFVMAAAFPLAVFGNTMRMMCILIAAEFDGQSAGNFVHENTFFSLLPYVPAFLGLMLLGHWLRDRTPPAPQALPSTTA